MGHEKISLGNFDVMTSLNWKLSVFSFFFRYKWLQIIFVITWAVILSLIISVNSFVFI